MDNRNLKGISVETKKPWKSKNFWTNLGSAIIALITYFTQLDLDPDLGGQVYEMIDSRNWPLLLITGFNIVNMIVHLTKNKTDKETIETVVQATLAKVQPSKAA